MLHTQTSGLGGLYDHYTQSVIHVLLSFKVLPLPLRTHINPLPTNDAYMRHELHNKLYGGFNTRRQCSTLELANSSLQSHTHTCKLFSFSSLCRWSLSPDVWLHLEDGVDHSNQLHPSTHGQVHEVCPTQLCQTAQRELHVQKLPQNHLLTQQY